MTEHEQKSLLCTHCNVTKPTNQFTASPAKKAGSKQHNSWCKGCINEATKWSKRLRKYGLTKASYQALLDQQGGRCAICGVTPDGRRYGTFHVDHNHSAPGTCRGLLCHGCNTGLGAFKESSTLLLKASNYLQQESQ